MYIDNDCFIFLILLFNFKEATHIFAPSGSRWYYFWSLCKDAGKAAGTFPQSSWGSCQHPFGDNGGGEEKSMNAKAPILYFKF